MAARHVKKTAKKNIWLKLLLCISLIAGVTATTLGTHAWMYYEPTAEVITLTGHNLVLNISDVAGDALIPGNSYTVKPYVTVPTSTSINCYVFVKVSGSSTYFTYSVDTSIWTQYSGNTAYYYKEVTKNTSSAQSFDILTGDKVTIPTSATLTNAGSDRSMTVTACAVQRVGGITLAQAYTAANSVLG
ncbi:MAG: hypothetical protein IKU10_04335 [Clostridia bacterium]|nr:hypothetical protein [Clostridia bacterium]